MSCQRLLEICKRIAGYAERRRFNVVREFVESAKKLFERGELDEL